MLRYLVAIAVLVPLVLLSGCGGGVESGGPKREVPGISGNTSPIKPASEEASASEVDHLGWRALRLTNGMVTLVVVPDIGGRIVEFKMGGHPYLWLNPAQTGKIYSPPRNEQERKWANFGGYSLWPGPPERWKGPPDPLGSFLEGAKWTAKIITASGRNAEIEVRSPEDKQTGLQITRSIKLFGGSSQVRISEQVTNISGSDQNWAFVRVTQVPGSLESGVKYSDKAHLYIPVGEGSKATGGFVTLTAGGSGQYKLVEGNLLQVGYQGRKGRIGVDSQAGWLAHVDEQHEFAFIQRFQPSKLGDFPEQGSTVIVDTVTEASYLLVGLYSPSRTMKPQESQEIVTDWYAARVGGPIVETTEVAAIQKALKVERADGKLKVSGVLGVFQPGSLAFVLQDGSGTAIGQPTTLKVTPAEVVKLDQTLADEKDAAALVVELQNDSGTPLGEAARLNLKVSLADKSGEGAAK